MKKIVIAIAFLVTAGIQLQAQEESFQKNQNKHELRLDALEILLIPNLEFNYEYVISKYSGVGASLSYSFDDEFSKYQKFSFAPYYRQYFFNKKDFGARGLFVEGLMKFAGGQDYETREFFGAGEPVETEDWFNIGVGLSVGQKWVSDNGFVFEISAGGGRYLIDDKGPAGFFRGGILIGYRFL